jgi:MFS transporter, DHA1 family, tetracycline resistance protein
MKLKSFISENTALSFILVTMFLNFLGFSLIIPVLPFLVEKYVEQNAVGLYVGLLMSAYALCQFLAAPALGMLSDRFGRRPILLISLLGSIIGYIFLGIGGALWILFIGRIIDGFTGGNISTVYAYIADITKPKERGKYYGLLGAVGGVGFMLGPVIGGYTATIHLSAPFYIAAAVTLLNLLWGFYALPESLKPEHRLKSFELSHLNPFSQLRQILSFQVFRLLFTVAFFFFLPFAAFQSTNALFMKEVLHWGPAGIGTVLFIVGVIDILTQGFLIRKLLPLFGEFRLATAGLVLSMLGFFILTVVSFTASPLLLYAGVIIFIIGDGLFEPSISGLIANSVEAGMQGRMQGANQSMLSLARVIGPLYGGWTYQIKRELPYIGNIVLLFFSIVMLFFIRGNKKVVYVMK